MSNINPDLPQPLTPKDIILARELMMVRQDRQRFYNQLDSSLRALFSYCDWWICPGEDEAIELIVICPRFVVYKRIHNRIDTVHSRLRDVLDLTHSRVILECPGEAHAYYEHEIDLSDEALWFDDDDDFFFDEDEEEDDEDWFADNDGRGF
ncbi:hypothetical protein JJD41_04885 [Oxynema sp. CENA135]|uniref:hypothetical protein n=1 Tax=Oxynema sp. CENA135 TaxID=984206 RepID=UPI00190B6FAC|nr:hypothetical protein [Oxynema sp. CENA135]MBK4729220.1 hypothetical protein [Oxynema sp. CENA135]